MTSFYFSTKSLLLKNTKTYLNDRITRIIIPYFVWTIIYLLARFLGGLIGSKESFNRLISDPVNVILFGAAGVQLYFLPLLFCGILIAIPVTKILKRFQSTVLNLYFFISIFIFYLTAITGNDFALGEGIAFKEMIDISSFSKSWSYHLMRLMLVFLAWSIRCVPYIIFSIIVHKYEEKKSFSNYLNIEQKRKYKLLILIFIPLLIGAILISKLYFINLLLPYISFIYAILISELISRNSLISYIANKLGHFSFSIYLIHALITAGFLPIMIKLYPQILTFQLSSIMLIISAAIIFFVSLTIAYFISLNKTAARILFAM